MLVDRAVTIDIGLGTRALAPRRRRDGRNVTRVHGVISFLRFRLFAEEPVYFGLNGDELVVLSVWGARRRRGPKL